MSVHVKGRVLYGNRAPVADALVEVFDTDIGFRPRKDSLGFLGTNANGWFDGTLPLPAGDTPILSVTVSKDGQSQGFDPLLAGEPELVTGWTAPDGVTPGPVMKSHLVRGRVLHVNRVPVGNASVEVFDTDLGVPPRQDSLGTVTTDENGEFTHTFNMPVNDAPLFSIKVRKGGRRANINLIPGVLELVTDWPGPVRFLRHEDPVQPARDARGVARRIALPFRTQERLKFSTITFGKPLVRLQYAFATASPADVLGTPPVMPPPSYLVERNASASFFTAARNAALSARDAGTLRTGDRDSYRKIFDHVPASSGLPQTPVRRPASIARLGDELMPDALFAEQRIVGSSPLVIARVGSPAMPAVPEGFDLPVETVRGIARWSLEELAAAKRLYVCDYRVLRPALRDHSERGASGLCTVGLFYLADPPSAVVLRADDVRDRIDVIERSLYGGVASTAPPPAEIAFRTSGGTFVSAQPGDAGTVIADRSAAAAWEHFLVEDLGADPAGGRRVALLSAHGRYLSAGSGGRIAANRDTVGAAETFTIAAVDGSPIRHGSAVCLRAHDGRYVAAEGGGGRELVADRSAVGPQETFVIPVRAAKPAAPSVKMSLRPLAILLIEKDGTRSTIVPGHASWNLAKLALQANDTVLHELRFHLWDCHLAMNHVVLAMVRHLDDLHPLRDLLARHTYGALWINNYAYEQLVNKDGLAQRLTGLTFDGVATVLADSQTAWSWRTNAWSRQDGRPVKADIAARGLTGDALPYFPYRDDGALVYNAIRRFTGEYVDAYYDNDAEVVRDEELAAWFGEMAQFGIGQLPAQTGRDALAEFVAELIFQLAVHHAAVNDPQWDYNAFSLDMPAYLRELAAPDPALTPDQQLAARLPFIEDAIEMMELMGQLGVYVAEPGGLGHYRDFFALERTGELRFADGPAEDAATRFRDALTGIESAMLQARDRRAADGRPPYDYLRPSLLDNSAQG